MLTETYKAVSSQFSFARVHSYSGVSFLDFAVETATVFMKVKNWPIVPMEVETTEENKNACWPATHAAISN